MKHTETTTRLTLGALTLLTTAWFGVSMFSQRWYGDLQRRETELQAPMTSLLHLAIQSEARQHAEGRVTPWTQLSDLDGVPLGTRILLEGVSWLDIATGTTESGDLVAPAKDVIYQPFALIQGVR